MEPVYRHIEFCRDAETLWGKMREGRWDWLGVHPKGQFVLGSPCAARLTDHVALTLTRGGASEGEHGVRVDTEPNGPSSFDWLPTEAAAVAAYGAKVAEYRAHDGPVVARIRRVEHNRTVDQEFVVSRPPTYR